MADMTPEDFDRQFAAAEAGADHALIEHGRVEPMYFVFDRSGRMNRVVADNSTPDRKHASLELARLTAIAADADLVCHRTEAWIVVGETPPGVAPSEPTGGARSCS